MFTNGMKAMINIPKGSFPSRYSKLLFINNGVNKIKLDSTNEGSGFNLNLHCFLLKDSRGKTKCYHFVKM